MKAATRLRIGATIVCVVLLVALPLCAQFPSSLSGPVLGYLFDRNVGKFRPVRGILGSATIGTPVESSFTTSQIFSLGSRHAIASTNGNTELAVITLEAGQSSTAMPGIPVNPTRGAGSLQGTAAALHYSDAQEVRIVTGLPAEPSQSAVIHIDRPLTQMAINNDGTVLVYSVVEGEGEAIYSWTASSGNARFLASAVSVSSIVINRNGDAILTDRGANEVFAIWDPGGGAIRKLLAGVEDGVLNPVGVGVSSSNRIYVANAGSVLVLDSNGRALKTRPCNCTISGMYPFRDLVFRLTDGITQTTYLLDATSAEERILFVPPPQD